MADEKKESWASGNLYHDYMGRWSEMIAQEFLVWLNPASGSSWLDIGCGTGALTGMILNHVDVQNIIGIDPSQDFLIQAQHNIQSTKVHFQDGDGSSLHFNDDQFDYVVSGLALNFMSDPQHAIQEMVRVVKRDGWVAIYVWDYAGKMEWLKYFWSVAVMLDETAHQYDEGQRFPICQPDKLHNLFKKGELRQIEVRSIDVPATFDNFEHYWDVFQIGSFPAPAYLKALSADQRTQFKDKLRSTVPRQNDGSIQLITRAWAVRGQKN